MLKQKIKNWKLSNKLVALAVAPVLLGASIQGIRSVSAVASCSTIADCQQQINDNNSAVAQLQNQATSYQDAMSKLNGQINQVQAIINANVAEQNDLENRIAAAQTQLDQQRKTLGENIKAMYLEGNTSALEILASSQTLSQYVDRQTYRNAVSDKVKTSVDTIAALESQMQAQQKQLALLIAGEQTQKDQLASAQYQQQQLLGYNQSQQASYNAQTAQNQQKLNALIAAQRRANSSVSSGGYYFIHFPGAITADPINGSYPYASYPFSMSLGGCTTDGPDAWGYCTRQCVSYAAWAVEYSGRAAPIGWGDAASWYYRARDLGWLVSYPQPGDVAISTSGYWGHAMYVESVSGNTFQTSEYNTYLDGQLHSMTRSF